MALDIRKAAAVCACAFTFISSVEGVTYVAAHQKYDPPKVITVCNGITNYDQPNLKAGDRFTPAMCQDLLSHALPKYEACLDKHLPGNVVAAMTVHQYVAHLSFVYNEGCGNYLKSDMYRAAIAGDIAGSCNAFVATNADGTWKYDIANHQHLK